MAAISRSTSTQRMARRNQPRFGLDFGGVFAGAIVGSGMGGIG